MQLKFLILSFLISLAFVFETKTYGQLEIKQFNHLSVDEGLKNSRVVSLLQDTLGYMWFATHSGIDKFDGREIQNYSLTPSDNQLQKDNIINCIAASQKYDILCGTKKGNIYFYNREKDVFQKLLPNESNDNLYNIYSILALDNIILVGTSQGLFYFNSQKKEITAIKEISAAVNSIIQTSTHHFLIGTSEGLFQLSSSNKKSDKIQSFLKPLKMVENVDIRSLYYNKKRTLYVGTHDTRVLKYSLDARDSITLVLTRSYSASSETYPINDIIPTPKNSLALAVDGLGLIETGTDLELIKRYSSNPNNISSLSSNGLYKLYFSANNILWVATYGGGVNFSDPNKKQFNTIQHTPYLNNSLRNNAVNAILEVNPSELWIGTKTGISILNKNGWYHIPPLKSSNKLHIMSMLKCNNGNIWCATYGSGLIKIDPQTKEISIGNSDSKDFRKQETDFLYKVFKDSKGRIWTGGIKGGITIIDNTNQSRQIVNISNVRSMAEHEEAVLVGTLFGLFIVDMETLKVTRPSHLQLLNNRIISISLKPDDPSQIYLGTDANGLLIWNQKKDSIIRYTNNSHSLPSNYIRGLVWDPQNNLWVTSTGGLSSFKDSIFVNYNKTDGLANTEFTENAVCGHSSGQLYLGGHKGVSYFFPEEITPSDQKVKPILKSIKLFGEELTINPDGPLYKNINLQKGLNLTYNQNSLNINFGAISYTNPHKIRFMWRLKGFEEKWNEPTTINEAIYSKLPPGNYTFQIRVANDDGIWQSSTKEFSILINDPFWKTGWAYLTYIVLFIGLLALIFHYYHTIVQEKHALEKQQFFISVAHDLRTPLSLIKLPIEKLVHNTKSEDAEFRSLSLVKRNVDRLTNLVNQLLDYQKSDLKKMQLQIEEHNLHHFLKEKIESFKPLAEEKRIETELTDSCNSVEVWFDKNKLEKVIFNLLSNAFKYTPCGGKIRISIQQSKNHVTINVSDTGEGIPKDQQNNIFQRYYRATNAINSQEVGSGVGLILSRQLVELHHGKISFESEEGKGSTFTIELLKGKDHFSAMDFASGKNSSPALKPILRSNEKKTEPLENGPKILIVEDNTELIETLASELQNFFRVFKAYNGQQGIDMANEIMPDLIISDVMMPVLNGHQLCIKLKSDLNTCHVPIILLTALDSLEYKKEGIERGADAYIEKPFDINLLITQIKTLLRNRELLKNKFLLPSSEIKDTFPSNPDQNFLEKIREFVVSNIDNPELSVEATAAEIGISRPVLYRKIKSLTNLSPQHFLMTIKLKEAARIMKQEEKNISETAYMIGFSDPKYFSQIFKKHFGMTPSQYLKKSE
ncbi:hybrid sensor histidine kinase/response regulator transcription factor [Marinilabilia rubra]|uniref:hybrid sensor histidine kinase/response regulator transcription factor n=1 Tax=Marinilabilia rubra TaxID=2162893 RepID=UPI0011B1F966|nr:hybrid sensor histidine kinase/response regulator transcription factor [Marinilabilia rubra]